MCHDTERTLCVCVRAIAIQSHTRAIISVPSAVQVHESLKKKKASFADGCACERSLASENLEEHKSSNARDWNANTYMYVYISRILHARRANSIMCAFSSGVMIVCMGEGFLFFFLFFSQERKARIRERERERERTFVTRARVHQSSRNLGKSLKFWRAMYIPYSHEDSYTCAGSRCRAIAPVCAREDIPLAEK